MNIERRNKLHLLYPDKFKFLEWYMCDKFLGNSKDIENIDEHYLEDNIIFSNINNKVYNFSYENYWKFFEKDSYEIKIKELTEYYIRYNYNIYIMSICLVSPKMITLDVNFNW